MYSCLLSLPQLESVLVVQMLPGCTEASCFPEDSLCETKILAISYRSLKSSLYAALCVCLWKLSEGVSEIYTSTICCVCIFTLCLHFVGEKKTNLFTFNSQPLIETLALLPS